MNEVRNLQASQDTSSQKPLVPECIKCGTTEEKLTIDHMWPVALLGLNRKMDPNLDLTDLRSVVNMRENKWYFCRKDHDSLDNLKMARFFNVNICDKKKCPILNPKQVGSKTACQSYNFCNMTGRELLLLQTGGKKGPEEEEAMDIMDVSTRGNPAALAKFNRDSYPVTENPLYQKANLDGLIVVEEALIQAVGNMTEKQTGLSDDLLTGYIKAGLIVADHLAELKERRMAIDDTSQPRRLYVTSGEMPSVPQTYPSRFAYLQGVSV